MYFIGILMMNDLIVEVLDKEPDNKEVCTNAEFSL